jgi:hypothetical protein
MLERDKKYLLTCKLTENDPAVIFQWNYPVLEQFVKGVTSCYEPIEEPKSYFITTEPGQMTVESLIDDIMATLAQVAGGRHGDTVFAPNNLSQFSNIGRIVFSIETDNWLQRQYVEHIPESSSYLASLYTVTSSTDFTLMPCNLISLHNRRQIFK